MYIYRDFKYIIVYLPLGVSEVVLVWALTCDGGQFLAKRCDISMRLLASLGFSPWLVGWFINFLLFRCISYYIYKKLRDSEIN